MKSPIFNFRGNEKNFMRWFAGTNYRKSFPCPDMKKKRKIR